MTLDPRYIFGSFVIVVRRIIESDLLSCKASANRQCSNWWCFILDCPVVVLPDL